MRDLKRLEKLDVLTLHDVVTIGDETDRDGERENGNLPERDGSLGSSSAASGPSTIDDSPRTDRVTDIVGTVSERSSASSEDLDKRVGVLDLVGVLLGVSVDASHALTFGSTSNTRLSGVDVVVHTVEKTADDHGGDTLEEEDLHVAHLVDLASAHGVVVESSHGPAERTALESELGVESLLTLGDELPVVLGRCLGGNHAALLLVGGVSGTVARLDDLVGVGVVDSAGVVGDLLDIIVVLDNSVVGNVSEVSVGGSRALEEEGSVEEHPPLDSVIALDDSGVNKGNEEPGGQESDTSASAHGDGGNVPTGLALQAKLGRSLVDNGESANGTGDEEEEGRGPDSPGDGVLAQVNNKLDEHEDGSTEASRDGGSHTETSKDGTESLTLVPTPLDLVSSNGGNTDTSNGRDERVCGGDVGRVSRAPHDPGGGGGQGTGEGHHLDTGVALEGGVGNNAVLDGLGGSCADGDGAEHFEDGTEDHGLSVGDGSGRNTSCPSVGDIV